ncbi:MAG: nucleotidyltransferase family protein [Bacteroidota bacterium]
MKAVILAAGKGERLRAITENIPKPMIRFRGKPILEHNIELCRRFGVTDLFINTHHLPEVIRGYFGDGSRWGVHIEYTFEPELLGTSSAVRNFQSFLSDGPFFVLYGDNYSDYDLSALQKKQQEHSALGVIAFHWREDTSSSGVAEFAEDGRISRFIEKPAPGQSDSHWVNAGIYYFREEILSFLPSGYSDFAKDIFPKLLASGESLYGVRQKVEVLAFDTPEMYNQSIKS